MLPVRWMVEVGPQPQLGATLRRLRLARGLSQSDAAAAMGIDQSVLSAYERGARAPRASQLRAINAYYDQPPRTLEAIAWDDQGRRDDAAEAEPIPGDGLAVGPADPKLLEAIGVLILLEDDDITDVITHMRDLAELAAARAAALTRDTASDCASAVS